MNPTNQKPSGITILGEHISTIRPSLIKVPPKLKEPYKPAYSTRPKTRKIGCAEFFSLCLSYSTSWIERKPQAWER